MGVGYYESDRFWRERVQSRWDDSKAPIRHVDPLLVLSALFLSLIGVVMIYSATRARLDLQGADTRLFATKQLVNLAVGSIAMVVAAAFDYRYWRAYAVLVYAAACVLLVAVLSPLGVVVNGARRWLEVGGFQLQPSELAKVAVIVLIAAILHERKGQPGVKGMVLSLGAVVLPMGLIYLQPDLGTLIVFVWLVFILMLVGGVKGRYMFLLFVAGLVAIVLAFRFGLLHDYQIARLTAFLDPGNTELARTTQYNHNQSIIAIGSGQIAGKGLFQGTQTNLSYVPENHTDFIFTVVGEEFGFLGSAVVLALFGVLLWRALRIAALAKDLFGTLIASGAVALIALQVFVNVGMTIGIMPVTGIPLPFVSYGGTSLLTGFILIGLLQNVHMRRL